MLYYLFAVYPYQNYMHVNMPYLTKVSSFLGQVFKYVAVIFLFFVSVSDAVGQTIINVDLTASPNEQYVSPNIQRSGSYCGDNSCVVFNITVHPGAQLINFEPTQVTGSAFYSVNCGPLTASGTPACLTSGSTTLTISFCKPGNNATTYTITTSTAVAASPDLNLRQGCSGTMSVTGLQAATTVWKSIFPGAIGAYNSYLSSTTGTSVTVTPQAGSPPYIDYQVSGTSTLCPAAKTDVVRVYTYTPLTVSLTPANATICSGGSGNITLTATPTGGDGNYTYAWSKNGVPTGQTTASIVVSTIGNYSVSVADGVSGCPPVTQAVAVTSAPSPVAPTVSPLSICAGSSASLTATAPGGTYAWYDAASGGNLLFTGATYNTPALATNTTYYVETTLNGCTSPRAAVPVTVNPIPAAPAASGASICSGTTATLTATAAGGGTFAWYDALTGGNLLSSTAGYTSPVLIANTTYYVQTTVNGCTSSRTAVTVTVNPTPVAPTASGAAICSGTNLTLTASAPGGLNYGWYDSPTGGNLLISGDTFTTPVLTSTTTYYVQQASAIGCVSARTAVIVTVNAIPVAPTASAPAICNGSTALITATAPGGTYQWYNAASGGTLLGTGTSYTTAALTANTTFYVQTVINGCTSPRAAVLVTVNPIPAAPTASGTTICAGSAASLSATGGGTYQWYDQATGGTLLSSTAAFTSPALTSNTTYYVAVTANGCTSSRTAVLVTVTPTPVAPTAAGAIICSSGTATLTATAPGGNYEWYDAASGGNLLGSGSTFTSPVLTSNTTYYVQTTISGCPSPRTAVLVTVNPTPAAPAVSGITFCSGSAGMLTATAAGGTIFNWYNQPTGGTSIATGANFITPVLTSDRTYYVDVTSPSGCPSARTAVLVSVTQPEIPAFTYSSGTYCRSGTDPAPVVAGTAGGTFSSTAGLVFLNSSTGLIDVSASTPGTYTITFVSNNSCAFIYQSSLTITDVPDASFAYNGPYCQTQTNPAPSFPAGSSAGIFSSSTGLVFVNSSTGEIDLANSTPGTYTVTNFIAASGGCAAVSASSSVTINEVPVVNAGPDQEVCSGTPVTLAGSIGGGASSASWSLGPGTSGSFDDPTLLNAVYTPAVGATSATLFLTTNDPAGPCTAQTDMIVLTFKPRPIIISSNNNTLCSGTVQNYTIISNLSGTTFIWSRPTITGISLAGVSGQTSGIITETLINTTNASIAVAYTIVPTANGCDGSPFTYTVTVKPTPVISSAATGSVCSGNAQPYTITSTVASPTFSWSRGVVAGINNSAVSGQSGSSITEALINTTNMPIVVRYVIVPSANSCAGPSFNYDVTVNPTPAVNSIASNPSWCNSTAQNYVISSNVSGATFSWSRALVTGISNSAVSGQTSGTISETLVNTLTVPVTVRYVIVPSANGCPGPSFDYDVTINPTPHVNSAAANLSQCSGSPQAYVITGDVTGAIFNWSRVAVSGISNAAVTGQTSSTITEVLTNTTNLPVTVRYVITPSAYGCTGPAFNYDVTVNPAPAVTSATANPSHCNNSAQNYAITSNVSGATFSWSRAAVVSISNAAISGQTSSSITETLINTSNLPVTVRYIIVPSAYGCNGPAFNYDVTVNPAPAVTSAAANPSHCNNSAQNYAITSNVTGATFSWSRALVTGISNAAVTGQTSGSITETLVNTSNAPVTVHYVIVPSAYDCPGTPFDYYVTVNPTPVVNSAATNPAQCSGSPQAYTITSTVTGATFTWSRAFVSGISNGALSNQSGNSITETLINTTNTAKLVRYVIVPSAYGCTGPAFNYDVTVNPTPVVNSAASNPAVCSGSPQAYTITSNVSGATFTWSRAGVSGISNAAVSGQAGNSITEVLINTSNISKTVRYIIVPLANGCAGPAFNYDVTVNPAPVVTSAASNPSFCNTTAQNYAITSNVSGATFTWSRTAVTGISNAALSNQSGNVITETLINTSNTTKVVRYILVPSANGCNGPAFNYDVTVNPTPVVNSAAMAVVCNSIAQNYLITSNVAGSSFAWSRAVVAGISNFAVNNQGSNSITETLVNTSNAPVVVRYIIIPTANGCSGPAFNYDVTVNPTPVITSAVAGTICNNTSQSYSITSNVTGATVTWSRAAVTGISNAAVSNQASSSIAEKLINTTSAPVLVRYTIVASANGCVGPAFQYSITVEPSPIVTNPVLSQTICSLASSAPVNLTSNVAGAAFTWTAVATAGISGFTASGTGAIPAQTLINAGTVQGKVTYIIIPSVNGCPGLPATCIININPKPATPGVLSNSPVCESSALNLSTPAIAGATYLWSGPNGFTSSLQNPVISTVSSAAAGQYSVMVTVNGCSSDAGSTTVVVTPTPAVPVTVTNSPICAGNTLTLSTNTVAGGTYSWTGPNGFTSSLQNPQISNTAAAASGVYSLRITVNGCTSVAGTTTVVVNSIPAAPTAGSNSPVCAGNTINLFSNSLSGATYSWTGPNGFTSNLRNPVIPASALANSGIYYVTASVGGCTGPAQAVTVQVNSTPVNPVLSSNSPVCTGYPVQLTATSFAGAIYSWTGPNGFVSNAQNPVINSASLANSGTYTVVINAPGCTLTSTRSITVKVNQTPISPASANNGPICVGKNLTLTASSVAGATYSWTGPNGFTSSLQNPVISNVSLANAGNYNVTVTVNACTSVVSTTAVVVNEPAIVSAGPAQTVCANNANVVLAGSVSGGSRTGVWSSSGTGIFLPDNTALKGTYIPSSADKLSGGVTLTLNSTNNQSCTVIGSTCKIIITPPPVADAGPDLQVCSNDPNVYMKAKMTIASGGVWSTNGTGAFMPSNTALNAYYVPSSQDMDKGSVKLTLRSTGNGNCIAVSDDLDVTIIPPPTINKMPVMYIFEGESVQLNPVVKGSELRYEWLPDKYLSSNKVRNPMAKGVDDQIYTLTVTGTGQCAAKEQLFVKVLKPIIIPNTITPNGDGINDVWNIKELPKYPGVQLKIFNRYGNQLYYSQGYERPWDGMYNGKPLPVGTYYYLIEINSDLYRKTLSGYIAIIK